jgi:hypothetical protein
MAKDRATIQYNRLLKLPDEVMQMEASEVLSPGMQEPYYCEYDQQCFCRTIVKYKLTVRQAAEKAKSISSVKQSINTKNVPHQNLEQELSSLLNTKVRKKITTGRGKSYSNTTIKMN